jgi:uncharacterized protein (DUF2236 family)
VDASVTDRLESVRAAIADALEARVVGDDAAARRDALVSAPGPRLFAADRPVHEIHADSAMFIGGVRALLLQSLHPLAMAGVAQHSDFRSDPWGRLQRTADFLASTTFGTVETAEQAMAVVRRVHERVTGTARDGRPYSASDPRLLRWVHVAEVDSFMAAHRAYGARRLSTADYDGYVADMAVVARGLGVPAPPVSVRGLADQLRSFRFETATTPEALDVARYLIVSPPVDAAARIPYGVLCAAAVAILPGWARAMLRLPPPSPIDALLARPAGRLAAGTIRWALEPRRPAATAD